MIEDAFLDYSERKLKQYLERIEYCLCKLSEDEVWSRGCENENSIGNLCLHLSGNVRQWIVAGVGGATDVRERDSEFQASGGTKREELRERLDAAVREACGVIRTLSAARLEEPITVQGYPVTVLQAIYHVVEHFSHHAGQILFATKALSGEDLGLHAHLRAGAPPRHSEQTP